MITVVMLIWVSVSGQLASGTAATIQGFDSIEACEKASPAVSSFYVSNFYDGIFYRVTIKCVKL